MINRQSSAILATLALLAGIAGAAPRKAAAEAVKTSEAQRPAAGDKRRIVGILDVRVEGVPKEIAKQFQSDLEKQLDSRAYWLAPQYKVKEMMAQSTKWTEGCVTGACLAEVRTQTGADIVLLAALNGSGTTFGYVVTLMRTDNGTVVAQESKRCDVCTVNEALASATLAAVKLVTAVPDTLPDPVAEAQADLSLATTNAVTVAKASRRKLGLWMTVTGILVAGVGTTLYFAMDRPGSALGLGGVGTGLALGGVATLTF